MKKIITKNMYNILLDAFANGKEFRLLIKNDSELKELLPEDFKKSDVVPFDVMNDTANDSYIETQNGSELFILKTELNGEIREIEITPENFQGIVFDGINLIKPYFDEKIHEPKISIHERALEYEKLHKDEINHSLECFRRNNPKEIK